uniref:QRICH1-like domain-containing protein n=1 Tax=Amphimedon queenslandica TaxID=400682 RepID=A0A1X7UN06_AMPQE
MDFEEDIDEDFLKGLEDIDWDKDWDDVEQLCGGSDITCCVADKVESKEQCSGIDDTAGDVVLLQELPESEKGSKSADAEDKLSEVKVTHTRKSAEFERRIEMEKVEKSIVERVPKNTVKSTNWGNSVFESWCVERQLECTSSIDMTETELNNNVSLFVHEAVKQDGCTPYPPNSLYQIVVSIQRYLREHRRPDVSFFNESNSQYDRLHKSLDARMKELATEVKESVQISLVKTLKLHFGKRDFFQ